uniref:Uncharacterized protein n=1 Tax=Meloidogyne enterolobii TaxID=390850 RepID=A0A6V7W154_MELEN|nr:unnamed protein product [Meloidogyne enterolobii]
MKNYDEARKIVKTLLHFEFIYNFLGLPDLYLLKNNNFCLKTIFGLEQSTTINYCYFQILQMIDDYTNNFLVNVFIINI